METAATFAGITIFVALFTGGFVKNHGWPALKWPLRTIVILGNLAMIIISAILFLQ